jgi:hypothetical protein
MYKPGDKIPWYEAVLDAYEVGEEGSPTELIKAFQTFGMSWVEREVELDTQDTGPNEYTIGGDCSYKGWLMNLVTFPGEILPPGWNNPRSRNYNHQAKEKIGEILDSSF